MPTRLFAGAFSARPSRLGLPLLLLLAVLGLHHAALAQTPVSLTFSGSLGSNGFPVSGTVTLSSAAPALGTVITLTSDDPRAAVPANLTIAAGAISGTFTVPGFSAPSNGPTTSNSALITATGNGVSQTASLSIFTIGGVGTPVPGTPAALSSLAVAPTNVTSGTTCTGTVTLTKAASSGTAVSLTSSNPAVKVPASVPVAVGATSATFAVSISTVPAVETIGVKAAYAGQSQSVILTVNPAPAIPNFTLSSYPARLTAVQGLSNTATLSVIPANGFSGNVTLTNSLLPAGVTIAYGTNPTSGASTVTFTASATAALGTIPITITGTSGSLNSSVTIPLTVAPVVSGSSNNVALAFSTGEVPLTAGSAAGGNVSLAVTPVNGYTGPVSFATTGLPSGVSVATNPTALSITGTAAQTTQVTFQATSTVTPGYYPVAVTGSGNGGATSTAVLGLNILPPPNSLPFTLTVTDNTTNAIPTGIASATVSLATSGGYSNPITLSLADDPSAPVLAPANTTDPTKIGVSFSVPTLSVSGTSALTLTVGASVAPGAYHFVVISLSTDGTVQHAAFTVFVAPEGTGTPAPDIDGSEFSETYTGDNPPYPLAAESADMQRFDFDPGNIFEVGSGSHIAPGSMPSPALTPNPILTPNQAPTGPNGLVDGTDDRLYVAKTNPLPYPYPYRACVRIKSFWANGRYELGSGTLIGNNHVLTAAHVVFEAQFGGLAKTIYVMPGYDYNWSQSHALTYTTANHTLVAKGFLKAATLASQGVYPGAYDDWALLDCNPISNGPVGQRGKPIGSYSSYINLQSVSDIFFPQETSHLAGYPGFTWAPATPVLAPSVTTATLGLCPDLFDTYVYNGDDGVVDTTLRPGLSSPSNSLLFSSMDASHGDSGAGLWYVSESDGNYYVYGVYDGSEPYSILLGYVAGRTDLFSQVTSSRYSIIKTQEKVDGDEPPGVYQP